MKILAMEKEVPGTEEAAFKLHLQPEAARVWELYQAGVLREMYFRADWPGAVLILECADAGEAEDVLSTLPLVQAGLITFDIIALVPYPGLARLFAREEQDGDG
jgi:muconolactone delta-isomerase